MQRFFFPPERRSHSSIGRNYLGWLPWQIFFTIQERHISRTYDLIINVIDIIGKLQVILQKLLLLNFLCRIMYFWYTIYWQAESRVSRKFEGYFCSNYLQIESWIWILFPVACQCGGTYQGFCHQFETKEIFNSKSLGEMQWEESRPSLFCGFCLPFLLEPAHPEEARIEWFVFCRTRLFYSGFLVRVLLPLGANQQPSTAIWLGNTASGYQSPEVPQKLEINLI